MNFDTQSTDETRPTDDIEPMIPMLPPGERRTRTAHPTEEATLTRPTDTTYATEYTRDYEEITPMVPRMW